MDDLVSTERIEDTRTEEAPNWIAQTSTSRACVPA